VEDTYNLLGTGIQQLVRALAATEGKKAAAWAAEHDLSRYFASSLKGSADLDWSDPAARQAFLTKGVGDARRLLRLASTRLVGLPARAAEKVRAAAALLSQLLLQDVVETPGPDGRPQAALREGSAPGRRPSASDPEVRHGRKSKSQRFTGHKASIATDLESQLLVDAEVLAGDAPDATGLIEQVERVEANTGEPVQQTLGDCADGSGATRQAFAAAGRALLAKVPQENPNGGRFPKSAFVLDLIGDTVTCPGGRSSSELRVQADGSKLFQFRGCSHCEFRPECTTAALGRTLTVHPQEALLSAAREWQQTEEGRAQLRERVGAEHRLARLGQLAIGQARYVGRKKTRFQLLLAATVANLRRTWNWERERQAAGEPPAAAETGGSGRSAAVQPAPGALSKLLGVLLTGWSALVGHGWRRDDWHGREGRSPALALTSPRMALCVPSTTAFRPRL
jgi:transposase